MLLLAIPFLFPLGTAFSATEGNNGAVIDTVIVRGNRTTIPSVILHEMELQPGSVAIEEAIDRDRRRLESLGLFSRVTIRMDHREGQNWLVVTVTELWYIWPGIYTSIDRDNPSRRFDYGLSLSHLNFRGRAEKLELFAWLGSTQGWKFNWDIPYLHEGRKWFAGFQGRGRHDDNPLTVEGRYSGVVRNAEVRGMLGRRFGLLTQVWGFTGFEVRVVEWPLTGSNDLENTEQWQTVKSLLPNVGFGLSYDSRPYRPWPRQGSELTFTLRAEGNDEIVHTGYLQPEARIALFHHLYRSLIFAWKIEGGRSFGDVPWYRNDLLDRYHGIRSPAKKDFQGTGYAGFTAELRGDLLPRRYVTFRIWKPLNSYTHDLKFGISWTLFSDFRGVGGKVDKPFDHHREDLGGWDLALGGGIVFHVPYAELLRLEVSRSLRFPSAGYLVGLRIGPAF